MQMFVFRFVSGVYRGGFDILVQAKLALSEGVTMQLTVRSTNADVAELIASAVGWIQHKFRCDQQLVEHREENQHLLENLRWNATFMY